MKLYDLPFFDKLRGIHLKRFYKNYNDGQKIEKFKDIHKGQRCFLLGTGPSLNETNFNLLKGEIIFGTNTVYKKSNLPSLTYYCVSDKNVWNKHREDISKTKARMLLSGHAGRDYLANKHIYKDRIGNEPVVFKDLGDIKRNGWVEKDITKGTYWGNTIMVDLCLQITFYMGFREVYLLGCDCSYKGKHHFDSEVFGFQKDTDSYYDEHWEKVFSAYKIIKRVYEDNNRKIYNSTPDGKLEVFKRRKLEDVLE